MHTVALAVTDGMLHFELSLAYEVFGADLTHLADPWYDLVVCGPGAVRAGRFLLEPDHGLDHLREADTVIVPGWADVDVSPPAELVAAVRAAHEAGARVASLCTGAFVLAEAGLLDGKRATTHWAHTRELATRFPEVEVDPDVLYVDNGDVLTSAGKAAAMDLCLHLVRLDHGSSVTNAVARRLVVPPHRDGGQSQFVTTPVPAPDNHPLAELFPWVMERLDQPLTVEDLARQARMSARNLGRHFRSVTGTTPLQWLLIQRIRHAQQLLETTDDSVDAIASATGMGTATTLRRNFNRTVGVPPDTYRRTFRSRTRPGALTHA
ncbi:Transcriptional regulator containing an amidase domain and an AraC-type DNA-binding HTH domain [[Actinomadura] parvosata subsp. kistnae]|uniref:AraC family transcriptional regulator n=1 Tax=[Actinomadura] parvosata subsp. kistnae TaxID=1909395 RepID=A0A1V0A8A8_9ACTN|nr:helix-turn-helix domain-containing protein [Nonomuraea sp. ATCC 55076]AQZ66434.1 AraC family transcriptional regulator [Nonomuraea sp. ATCC 55076]SPL95511.1 Transcriptional regulator containing an amidase domain and an AraC-type DNA-binding HTH domain [Actinomadura parvosata subsp. kistnae]